MTTRRKRGLVLSRNAREAEAIADWQQSGALAVQREVRTAEEQKENAAKLRSMMGAE